MSALENELQRLQARVEDTQKVAKALASALARLKTAAQTGAIADLEKGLAAIEARGREAAAAATDLSSAWTFDAREHLGKGYLAELKSAAAAAGVEIVEHDGRLSLFPVLLRIEPRELAVRVGKRLERRIRPAVLARHLAAVQKKAPLFNEQRFLELLYRAYHYLCGREWSGEGRGPARDLADVFAVLTLHPAAEYSLDEFGRDLLLLARRPELRTKDGANLHLSSGATGSKRSRQRVVVYDEHGREHVYVELRFVKGD